MARSRSKEPLVPEAIARRLREGVFVLSIAVALFLLLSFITYHKTDPSWSNTSAASILNKGGRVGALFADIFFYIFGITAYILPPLLIIATWLGLCESRELKGFNLTLLTLKLLGCCAILLACTGLSSLYLSQWVTELPASAGGILGVWFGPVLAHSFNLVGATVILVALVFAGVTLFSGLSWMGLIGWLGQFSLQTLSWFKEGTQAALPTVKNVAGRSSKSLGQRFIGFCKNVFKRKPRSAKASLPLAAASTAQEEPYISSLKKPAADSMKSVPMAQKALSRLVKKPVEAVQAALPVAVKKKIKPKKSAQRGTTLASMPGVDLLNTPDQQAKNRGYSDSELLAMSNEVEQRLREFGIEVKVVAVYPGPVITRFELELAPGVKVSRVSSLAMDLARSLSVVSVRVVEVIPGKSTVGLELPNKVREMVYLREVLESKQYLQARSMVSLGLGKDIAGNPVVVDLAKMPHLLVAGTTGSGKSVALNAMLLSILYKAKPEDVRLIMVDPKMLELSVYEGIPHLLTPVVTDMNDAANALRWCVAEMERRYRLMAHFGVRNLAGLNQKIENAPKEEPIQAPEWYDAEQKPLQKLATIVVLIDEFADMIMVVGKKVEHLIARIAQKARAAGIHLLLATQRPSVNVITGLIKANIPTRIAFQVSSKIDSRTILDQQGAQQLLGHGDMLYLAPGTGVPVRVHGAFVADEEVHRVVAEIKAQSEPEYIEEITQDPSEVMGSLGAEDDGEQDDLYDKAVQVVIETRRASISSLQRRFKIGYNRAARLVETMEVAGLVGPMEANGQREVFVAEGK